MQGGGNLAATLGENMKPDDVTIIQVVPSGSSTVGLGDDGKLYRYDYPSNSWVNP